MSSNISLNWRYSYILVMAILMVYLPGLSGGFIYDDYFNILENPAINHSDPGFSEAWTATLSGKSGPLGRPIAMLSFYINYQLGGFSPLYFKLFNIAVHILNALLILFIVHRLLNMMIKNGYLADFKDDHLAFWIALIWAIHPINLTGVLYVVQRMTSMAATFTLLGIYFYLNLRQSSLINIKGIITRLIIIVLTGVFAGLCKENGLLLFLFLLLIECLLFKWSFNSSKEKLCLSVFYFFVLGLPLCLGVFLLLNGDLTANYSGRTFDLTQRTLTETRVLWFYIFQILLPQASLFGLHHDDFILSTSLFQPETTLWSIVGFILIIAFAFKWNKKLPWLVFGLAFFFAGHVMESTILPLNLVHEHRNYLPSLGLIFIFVLSLSLIISRVKFINSNLFFLLITLFFSFITINRAYDWSDPLLLSVRLAQRHPLSVTANYEMGYAYAKVYEQTHDPDAAHIAKTALKKAESLTSTNMQPAIALAHVNAMLGEPEDHALINKIVNDFRTGKVSSIEIISLRQYVNCYIESKCGISDTTIYSMFNNLLENSSLQGRIRDDVLYIYSSYLLTRQTSIEQALSIMRDIASRNPDILEYQVKLISMLLENNKIEEANALMALLSKRSGIKWNVVKTE